MMQELGDKHGLKRTEPSIGAREAYHSVQNSRSKEGNKARKRQR